MAFALSTALRTDCLIKVPFMLRIAGAYQPVRDLVMKSLALSLFRPSRLGILDLVKYVRRMLRFARVTAAALKGNHSNGFARREPNLCKIWGRFLLRNQSEKVLNRLKTKASFPDIKNIKVR